MFSDCDGFPPQEKRPCLATPKAYKAALHGMPMTLKNEINADLLEFFRRDQPAARQDVSNRTRVGAR
jgi:hypothetical protein